MLDLSYVRHFYIRYPISISWLPTKSGFQAHSKDGKVETSLICASWQMRYKNNSNSIHTYDYSIEIQLFLKVNKGNPIAKFLPVSMAHVLVA